MSFKKGLCLLGSVGARQGLNIWQTYQRQQKHLAGYEAQDRREQGFTTLWKPGQTVTHCLRSSVSVRSL